MEMLSTASRRVAAGISSKASTAWGSSPRAGRSASTLCNVYSVSFTLLACIVLLLVGKEFNATPRLARTRTPLIHSAGYNKTHTQSKPLSGQQLYEAVKTQHPINRLQCGSWVKDYAQLHRSILEGRAPQYYTVMRSKPEFGNGLADRLATSVTILLYAMLTDRAFVYDSDPPSTNSATPGVAASDRQIKYFQPAASLWSALRSDFIDWRYNGTDREDSTIIMDHNCDKGVPEYKAFFNSQDTSKVGEGYHTVVWYADHAQVYAAFDNPHLKAKLAAMGLKRDTAFACLFDFLYRPVPEIVDMFKAELNTLLDPQPLKIGLQIRVGDWQLTDSYLFKPQQMPWLFDHWFQCAQDIEDEMAAVGQPVVWYTLTDIPELRQQLDRRWPGKLLINTHVAVEHTVKSQNRSDLGFKQAVGELWVFSLTSSQIITKISGFGKVPALISANSTSSKSHIFVIWYPMSFFGMFGLNNRKNLGFEKRGKCSTQFADPLSFVCNDFTGI